MRKITMQDFLESPERYELRSGAEPEAPDCPYGNRYEWIGYDKLQEEYVRFVKSVFKKLVQKKGSRS